MNAVVPASLFALARQTICATDGDVFWCRWQERQTNGDRQNAARSIPRSRASRQSLAAHVSVGRLEQAFGVGRPRAHGRSPRMSATVSSRIRPSATVSACAPRASTSSTSITVPDGLQPFGPGELQDQDRRRSAIVTQCCRRFRNGDAHTLHRPCSPDGRSERPAPCRLRQADGHRHHAPATAPTRRWIRGRPAPTALPSAPRTATSSAPRPISTSGAMPRRRKHQARARWAPPRAPASACSRAPTRVRRPPSETNA